MRNLPDRPRSRDGHLLLLHRTEQERRQGVASWLGDRLRAGQQVRYYERPDEPPVRSLRGILDGFEVPGGHAALRSGQLLVGPLDPDLYRVGAIEALLARSVAEGYAGLAISGEADTARATVPTADHLQGERVVDEVCRAGATSALCQYPATFGSSQLSQVCAVHTGGVSAVGLLCTHGPLGITLDGEVDVANADTLRMWLAGATRTRGPGTLPVLADRLEFCDVAGARALFLGTEEYRAHGGRVRLAALNDLVAQVLDLAGVADDGIEMGR